MPGIVARPVFRIVSGIALVAAVVLGCCPVLSVSTALPAAASPEPAGAVAAPVKLWSEDFEHGGPDPAGLTSYVGADGTRYTADPYWLDEGECNGIVLSFKSGPTSGCPNDGSRQNLQRLADLLGQHRLGAAGSSDPNVPSNGSTAGTDPGFASQTNRAVGEFSRAAAPPSNGVEFSTAADALLPLPNRFLSLSADVAELSCPEASGSSLVFSFLDGSGNEIPTGGSPYSVCADPAATYFTSPFPPGVTDWTYGGDYGAVATSPRTIPVLVRGNTAGYMVRNLTSTNTGNDHALDNFSVFDVTPRLDQEFASDSAAVGNAVDLRFTVTNTSDLGAKPGWSFTNTLPTGLTLAGPSPITTTCSNGAGSSVSGGKAFTVSGDLLPGQSVCTITVKVASAGLAGSAASPGTYSNCALNFGALLGLNAPVCASVQFHSTPGLAITKTSDAKPEAKAGEIFHYTVTVRNGGSTDYTAANPARINDDLSGVLDDATYNGDARSSKGPPPAVAGTKLRWAGALASGQSVTLTYSVALTLDGDKSVNNIACVPASEAAPGTANCARVTWQAPQIAVSKFVDPASGSPVAVGQDLAYALTFRNTGARTAQIDVVEDLRGVLDDATLSQAPTASESSWAVGLTGGGSSQIQGALEPGQNVTVRYMAKVNPDGKRTDNKLVSKLLPQGSSQDPNIPRDCPPEAEACTVHPVTSWSVTQKADKADALPGDTVTYTTTAVNTGAASVEATDPAHVTIDLTGTIDDAQYNGNAPSAVEYSAPRMAWSTALAVGEQRSLTYTVTVRSSPGGDHKLRSTIEGGSSCPQGAKAPDCTTETSVSALTVTGPGTRSTSEQDLGGSSPTKAKAAPGPNWAPVVGGLGALTAGLLANLSRFRHGTRSGRNTSSYGTDR
jgi:uncharacterized repeat protein (TIGR01451 family)